MKEKKVHTHPRLVVLGRTVKTATVKVESPDETSAKQASKFKYTIHVHVASVKGLIAQLWCNIYMSWDSAHLDFLYIVFGRLKVGWCCVSFINSFDWFCEKQNKKKKKI